MRGMSGTLAAVVVAILLVAAPVVAPAYGPSSNLCGTQFGICQIPWMPVGAPCYCGRDPGRVTFPPPNWNDACGTRYGVCRVQVGPIGAPCSCGRDPGQIIGR